MRIYIYFVRINSKFL